MKRRNTTMIRPSCFVPRLADAVSAAVLLMVVAGGCDRGPQTYAVQGKVVWADGNPWKGGSIQFTDVSNPQQVATGEIGPDGGFQLQTHFVSGAKGKTKPGAMAGEYYVYLDEPLPQVDVDGVVIIKPIVVPKTYKVEPRPNEFMIEARRLGKQ